VRMLTGSLEPALFRSIEKPLFFHRKINSPVVFCATLLHHLERFSGKISTGSAEPATGSAMGSYVIAVHNPAFRPGLLENHAGSVEPVAGSGQVPGYKTRVCSQVPWNLHVMSRRRDSDHFYLSVRRTSMRTLR
jgi:hypothetical protein